MRDYRIIVGRLLILVYSHPTHASWLVRWDPKRENRVFFDQSSVLFATYYHVQHTIHRPFIGKSSPLTFASVAMCCNAARACSRIFAAQTERGNPIVTSELLVRALCSADRRSDLTHLLVSGRRLYERCFLRDEHVGWAQDGHDDRPKTRDGVCAKLHTISRSVRGEVASRWTIQVSPLCLYALYRD